MAEPQVEHLLPRLGDRREYFDYLDRWTVGAVEELRSKMLSRALSKAFLLETSRNGKVVDAVAAIGRSGELEPIDDSLYRMRWPGDAQDWALVEVEDPRYPVFYTIVGSDIASRRIDAIVSASPNLDRTWLSASMFRSLWEVVKVAYPAHRFSRIVFEHESIYQRYEQSYEDLTDGDRGADGGAEDEEERFVEVERRRARMQVTERIGLLRDAVLPWEERYDPLASIVQLRIPAPGRGGHDVFYDGRFTNRSETVTSFRETIREVFRLYRSSTEAVEAASWPSALAQAETGRTVGAPLLIKFGVALDQDVFDRWMDSLRRKNNRFRLWGNPLRRGPGKVHMYAIDNHLWQPVDIEITREHLYALLPLGTCGNTVHRLVTNIQRMVDPKVSVFVGEREYQDLLRSDSPGTGVERG